MAVIGGVLDVGVRSPELGLSIAVKLNLAMPKLSKLSLLYITTLS